MILRYLDTTGLDDKSIDASGPIIADPFSAHHYQTVANPADLYPDFSGIPKDSISGQVDFALDYGVPVAGATVLDDTLTFHVSGDISAVDAHNSAGNPSDGLVSGYANAKFFLSAIYGGAAPGSVVGKLVFSELTLGTWDTLLTVIVTETDLVTMATGSTPISAPYPTFPLDLRGDREYQIQFFYEAEVPFGVDPPYATTISATFLPVPEPSAVGLTGLGAVLAGLFCRRHRRAQSMMPRSYFSSPAAPSAGPIAAVET